jgi:NTE family protein
MITAESRAQVPGFGLAKAASIDPRGQSPLNMCVSNTDISLVLGSGGARGLAHIGAIRCLEKHGFHISYISGSSIGALIGGIYAAGELESYADWVTQLSRSQIIRLLDWSFSNGAIFSSQRVISTLKDMVADRDIEELDIGFTAVATEIQDQREIWLNRGRLFEAVQASIAMPLIFAPVKRGDLVLVDGGLINPVPIAPTLNADTHLTIAVDLNGPAETLDGDRNEARQERESSSNAIGEKISQFVGDIMPRKPADRSTSLSALELALQSIDTMQRTIAQMKLAIYRPNLTIQMPTNLCTFLEFHRARELIDFGFRRTEETLQKNGYIECMS